MSNHNLYFRAKIRKIMFTPVNPSITADNQLNAKPVVKQRHPGDEFPVSQRGSTKGKQSTNTRV